MSPSHRHYLQTWAKRLSLEVMQKKGGTNALKKAEETEEEDENDKILLESFLNWEAEGGVSVNFQHMLQTQSHDLNTEIIELLIRWEEENIDRGKKGGQESKASSALRKDTSEVTDALAKLDREFEVIDGWLEKQIELFQDVQSKLASIDDESGALETNWQNLIKVQVVIDTIREELTLSKEDQTVLQHPERVIDEILRGNDLTKADDTLEPLRDAIAGLRRALDFKGYETVNESRYMVTETQWTELSQRLAAVQSQRQSLLSIATVFGEKAGMAVLNLFPSLLKHRALNEGARGQSISIKSISFAAIAKEALYFSTTDCPKVSSMNFGASYLESSDPVNAAVPTAVPEKVKTRFEKLSSNVLMAAQRTFHEALIDFLPVIENVLDMAPSTVEGICQSYVTSARDLMYAPLLKRLFKDIHTILNPKPLVLALSNSQVAKVLDRPDALVKLKAKPVSSSSPAILTSWAGLELLLVMVAPLVIREKLFVEVLLLFSIPVTHFIYCSV